MAISTGLSTGGTTPDVPDADSDALLARWIARDDAAGEELYRLYVERALAFAHKLLPDRPHDADEVAHDALTEGLESARRGEPPDRWTGWMLGIVKIRAFQRRRGGRPSTPGVEELARSREESPSQAVARRDRDAALKALMDSLPPDLRAAVDLRVRRQVPRPEAARELGITPQALDKRISRAFERIREGLERHCTSVVAGPVVVTPSEVARLRPAFRECFTLRYRDGLSEEQIAERLKLPAITVQERLLFACRKLGAASRRVAWRDDV